MTPSEKANELLETLKLKETAPTPLQKVVDHIGYKAQLFPASDKTKNIACGLNRETKVLMANQSDSPAEQRYAFAHAIGHAVLEDSGNVVDKKVNLHPTNEDDAEWSANQFADELLMENNLFLTKWDALGGNLGKLSSVFGVSRDRITARATALGIL